MNGYKLIRIRASGQVTEMVPDVARAMIGSGMAEEVSAQSAVGPQDGNHRLPESMTINSSAERAVAPAQAGPRKKSRR